MRRSITNQQGFTLVEVMIAFLVMAVGLIGMAGLQNASVSNNQSAYLRTQAMVLAFDMVERIRSNRVGAVSGTGGYSGVAGSAVSGCNTTAGCTQANLASNDVYEWLQSVQNNLPDGAGRICADNNPATVLINADGTCSAGCGSAFAAANPAYSVKIEWTDAVSGTTQCYATRVRL